MSVDGDTEVLTLTDGRCVPVREVRPGDAAALRRLVGRSSERTLFLRFFGPVREIPESKARHFAEVDGDDRFALVALDPDDPEEVVGVVRYDREESGSDEAEYAALVEDRFQGRGLGLGLTRKLIDAARERNVERLSAMVMQENTGMMNLLRSLGLPERAWREDGVRRIEVELGSGG
jgi:RimJ/RimL family protein N-acetyltransferase